MKSTKQAMENMEYVRRLLEQKKPGFAASLEFAASLVETSQEKPMDDELIRQCAAEARVACLRIGRRVGAAWLPAPACLAHRPMKKDGGVVPEVCAPGVRHARFDGNEATMV